MNFYFCEACGKRVTEHDIEAGRARNKQLKGVYCVNCAAGVMTMEMQAVSPDELRKVVDAAKQPQAEALPTSARKSGQVARPVESQRPAQPAEESRSRPVFLAIAAGIALAVLVTVILRPNSSPRAANPVDEPVAQVPPPPPAPQSAPASTPVREPVLEDRALNAFETLQKFEGAGEADLAERLRRVDAFLLEHGQSPVAVRARSLKEELTLRNIARIPEEKAPPSQPLPQPLQTPKTPPEQAPTPTPLPLPETVSAPKPPPQTGRSADELLVQTIELLAQDALTAAMRNVEKDAPASESAVALKAALQWLEKREQEWLDGLAKRVGEKIQFETAAGASEGTLKAVQDRAMKLEKPVKINGEVKGILKVSVPVADVLPASREKLVALPPPAATDGWTGLALMSLARRDFNAIPNAIRHVDGPLRDPLAALARTTEREARAMAAWSRISQQATSVGSAARAKQLLEELAAFTHDFADSTLATSSEMPAKMKEMKETLERLALGLDPRILGLFKGRVIDYDARTQVITILYNFQNREQCDDFVGSVWAPPGDHTGLTWKKGELTVFGKSTLNWVLVLPQYLSGTVTLQLDHKKARSSWNSHRFEVGFYHPDSTAKCEKVSFRSMHTGSSIISNNAEAKSAETLLGSDGTLEVSCLGNAMSVKANGKLIVEHKLSSPNDHTGILIGGGIDSYITLTRMQVSGRLSPVWLAKALEARPKGR
jgi:hypothetical protein